MILRVRLYLLIAVLLLIVASFETFFVLNSGAIIINGFTAHYADGGTIFSTLPLNVILWLSALFSFSVMFMFKNRILQMRLTTYTVIILLGFYLLVVYYRYYAFDKIAQIQNSQMSVFTLFPFISAVFVYLANREVKKIEEKIRSENRFR